MNTPVNELQRRMSAYEFAEYRAYFSIEPYPEVRADIRNAQLCATVANSTPFRKKGAKPIDPSDFLKPFDYWGVAYKAAQNVEVMKSHAKAWTRAFQGRVWEPKEE
jgi:hypothetical protein